jgi:phenylpyruvate tautomerase PptA (4-oxalocrotonate tautomerase family)
MSYFTGPYLRIYAPKCSLEQRKIMAAELTEAIAVSLQLDNRQRQSIQIHFNHCHLDAVAVGGRLLSETQEPYYHLEFCDIGLNQVKKAELARCLMPLMLELLNWPPAEQHRVSLVYHEIPVADRLIGSSRQAAFSEGRA